VQKHRKKGKNTPTKKKTLRKIDERASENRRIQKTKLGEEIYLIGLVEEAS
jgi:hypothetical protein